MMTTNLLRNLSFHSRRLRFSPFNSSSSSIPFLSQPTSFFSSRSDPPPLPHTQEKQQPLDLEEVSNEEFKKRVARLREGDAEAKPSVFEAILQRTLTGKPIDADQELMSEILGKGAEHGGDDYDDDEDEDDESDSDLEGMSDSDSEDNDDNDIDIKPGSKFDDFDIDIKPGSKFDDFDIDIKPGSKFDDFDIDIKPRSKFDEEKTKPMFGASVERFKR